MLYKRIIVVWGEKIGEVNTAALFALGAARKVGGVVALDKTTAPIEVERPSEDGDFHPSVEARFGTSEEA